MTSLQFNSFLRLEEFGTPTFQIYDEEFLLNISSFNHTRDEGITCIWIWIVNEGFSHPFFRSKHEHAIFFKLLFVFAILIKIEVLFSKLIKKILISWKERKISYWAKTTKNFLQFFFLRLDKEVRKEFNSRREIPSSTASMKMDEKPVQTC